MELLVTVLVVLVLGAARLDDGYLRRACRCVLVLAAMWGLWILGGWQLAFLLDLIDSGLRGMGL